MKKYDISYYLTIGESKILNYWPNQNAVAEYTNLYIPWERISFDLLKKAWIEVLKRHTSLRCYFVKEIDKNGKSLWRRKIHSDISELAERTLSFIQLPHSTNNINETILDKTRRKIPGLLFQNPFQEGSIIYKLYFCDTEGDTDGSKQRLLTIFNHIAMDGFSLGCFLSDLKHAYNQFKSGVSQISFPTKPYDILLLAQGLEDYSSNPSNLLFPPSYWSELFSKNTPLSLPTTVDPTLPSSIIHKDFTLPLTFFENIKKVSHDLKIKQTTIMLSALIKTTKIISNQSEGVLQIITHGRIFPDRLKKFLPPGHENIINTVTNMPVLYWVHVSQPEKSRGEIEILQHINEITNIMARDGLYDYECCARKNPKICPFKGPRLSFNIIPSGSSDMVYIPLSASDTYRYSIDEPFYLFKAFVLLKPQRCQIFVHYDQHLYSSETVDRFLKIFSENLLNIIENLRSAKL